MMKNVRVWIYVLTLAVVLPGILLKILPQNEKSVPELTEAESKQQTKISLLQDDGSIFQLELEDYVLAVVAAEMPAKFDIEALKAQAVLARTYALKRSTATDKHPQGALCTESSCCQAYCTEDERTMPLDKIQEAVNATAGQVLTYNDALIEATYFSCSGGYTEDAAAVWGTDVPYLQAVASPGEEKSAHFVTTTKMSTNEFSRCLGVDLSQGGIGQPVYTDGGGIEIVTIGGKEFTGVQLRQLLGLKSTALKMSIIADQVVITAKGYGHRVGMSQYGADAMAASGSTYEQILSYYYPGTQLNDHKCLTK